MGLVLQGGRTASRKLGAVNVIGPDHVRETTLDGHGVSLTCIITNVYLYEEDDDDNDEEKRGTKAKSDDVTAKCVPYARRVALTCAERFRT